MIGRLIFNAALFAILLGGIGGFLLKSREGLEVVDVVVVVVLGSLWAGSLVALIETRIYPIVDVSKRSGLAALCGSLAYLGLFSGVSFLAGFGTRPTFLLLGLALGAGSHGLRARIYGGPKEESSSEPDGHE
ncbi:MAG: hypothetical protein Q8O67_25505 [Deltaproteobacteria bacterium]|nr:hypothetical protein [Deltaproteobacteria bacterium]